MGTAEIERLKADQTWKRLCQERGRSPLSIFNILHCESWEDGHTYFLAWLLNPDESHGLGDFALRLFLAMVGDAVLRLPNGKMCREDEDIRKFADLFLAKDCSLSVDRIGPHDWSERGVMDLCMEMRVNGQPARLVVENKICSPESNEQTCRYWDELIALQKSDSHQPLGVYMTPKSSAELRDLTCPECACNNFVQINYQMLLDDVIEPCLERAGDDARVLLQQYIRTLGYSADRGIPIMAVSKQERDELRALWNNHKEVFRRLAESLATDPDMEDEARECLKRISQPVLRPLQFIQKLDPRLAVASLQNWKPRGATRARELIFMPFSERQPNFDANKRITSAVKFYFWDPQKTDQSVMMALIFADESGGQRLKRYAESLRKFISDNGLWDGLAGERGKGLTLYTEVFTESDVDIDRCVKVVRSLADAVERWFKTQPGENAPSNL